MNPDSTITLSSDEASALVACIAISGISLVVMGMETKEDYLRPTALVALMRKLATTCTLDPTLDAILERNGIIKAAKPDYTVN